MMSTYNDKAPILPVLKDPGWPHADKCVCRRLAVGGDSPYLPWVAFGYDRPHTFEFLRLESFPNLDANQISLIEQAALRNLSPRQPTWQRQETRLGLFRKMVVLFCVDDFLAAEHVLNASFMRQAQYMLKTDLLAVGVPRRGLLVVTDGTKHKRTVGAFAGMVSAQYHSGDSAPITPMCFAVAEGEIVGLIQGSEEIGRQIVQEERKEAQDEPQITVLESTDPETGLTSMTVLAGGPNVSRLALAIQSTVVQVLQDERGQPGFSGSIDVVINPHITPPTPEVVETLGALQEHLEGFLSELDGYDGRPLERPVQLNFRFEGEDKGVSTGR